MTVAPARASIAPPSLARLRLRLTAWYAGTFFAILTLLGVGMFAAITRRFDNELDASLRDAAHEVARAARLEVAAGRPGEAVEIARILRIPDRALYLTDTAGRPLGGTAVDEWLRALAVRGAAHDSASATFVVGERILRAHAERFPLKSGAPAVAIAAGDEVELEDKYTNLIIAFGAAALASVLLVAAGGYLLARKSTAPVERAVEHMRRFMADAAHELRTPIAVMRSRAEVALARPRDAGAYVEALRSLERETVHVGRIVDDLLTLARADAGQRPIQRSRVFLDDVMLDAADAARAIAAPKGVRLEVGAFEEAPVTGDPQLLRELVIIILDNAVKFTATGGVVRAEVRSVNGGATLTVVDTGIGIPAEQLPHVFERFYRGDAARTREAGGDGVGLGLSIAQWITSEHGASIRIDSHAGQGTRVVVHFPSVGPQQHLSSS